MNGKNNDGKGNLLFPSIVVFNLFLAYLKFTNSLCFFPGVLEAETLSSDVPHIAGHNPSHFSTVQTTGQPIGPLPGKLFTSYLTSLPPSPTHHTQRQIG